jgi:hypothetical protein
MDVSAANGSDDVGVVQDRIPGRAMWRGVVLAHYDAHDNSNRLETPAWHHIPRSAVDGGGRRDPRPGRREWHRFSIGAAPGLVTLGLEVTVNCRHCVMAVAMCLPIALAACATGSPRQRPLDTSPIETGAGTIDAERKRLQGRWTLESLSVTSEDGRVTPIEATGALNFDGFGNLQIEYRMSESGRNALEGLGIKTPNLVLSTSGNVAIDPRQRQITYLAEGAQQRALGFDPDLAARRANPFTLERARFYTFVDDDTLTLATHHPNGSDAAMARWKRAS